MAYYIGQKVFVTVLFEDENGDAADPTVVTVSFRDPDNVFTTYAGGDVSNLPAVGEFRAGHIVTQGGRWSYRAEGSGNFDAVVEGEFDVEYSLFEP